MTMLTGRAFIDVPGFGRLSTNPGASLNIGGVNRGEVVSDQQVEGYRETLVAPEISFTINHKQGFSLKQLGELKNVNVTFQTDSGTTWVLREAWVMDPPSMSGGEVQVTMKGKSADEVTV